jgi:hypothetical protein
VGIVHQQRQIRGRTIDARPNEPSEVAFADGLARLEARIDRLEALVTQLSRDALRDAVTDAVTRNGVTRDAQSDAGDAQRVTGDAVTKRRHVVPGLDPDTRNVMKRHARNERQRRYRERKKQQPGT